MSALRCPVGAGQHPRPCETAARSLALTRCARTPWSNCAVAVRSTPEIASMVGVVHANRVTAYTTAWTAPLPAGSAAGVGVPSGHPCGRRRRRRFRRPRKSFPTQYSRKDFSWASTLRFLVCSSDDTRQCVSLHARRHLPASPSRRTRTGALRSCCRRGQPRRHRSAAGW